MTTSAALKNAQAELMAILLAAGLIDGESPPRHPPQGAVAFWDTAVKLKGASDQQTYLVWTLVSADKRSNADDKVRAREAFASFDIYTRRSKTSKQVQDLISSLDEEALEKGWQFEFNGPAEYERDTAIYHIAFNLYKIFK